jgi:RNA polymerase sigma factor (TIGR02999 family)
MNVENTHEITHLLLAWGSGDPAAYEQLSARVYHELRGIAQRQMRHERNGHTLNPSALVNEAFLKLMHCQQVQWQDRLHFYNFAARLMRQVLVNYAETHQSGKRWGERQQVPLDETLLPTKEKSLEELLALDEALEQLAAVDERCARVVELLFFGGLTEAEVADVLGVSTRTVKRDWQFAKLWLRRALTDE